MVGIKERELLQCAKQTLRIQPAVLLRRVAEFGKPFGSPWSQDEKFATLAAWLALVSRSSRMSDPKNPTRSRLTRSDVLS
jgi:hypothetical protein